MPVPVCRRPGHDDVLLSAGQPVSVDGRTAGAPVREPLPLVNCYVSTTSDEIYCVSVLESLYPPASTFMQSQVAVGMVSWLRQPAALLIHPSVRTYAHDKKSKKAPPVGTFLNMMDGL